FVFAINVPLAVIIYWVTTNFWSVGQQYMLLKTHPLPAAAGAQAAPAGAAAAGDNGEGRKGLGPLSMFRGLSQPRATEERSPATTTNKNGDRNNAKARAGDAKDGKAAPRKQGGQAAKGAAPSRPGPGQRGGRGPGGGGGGGGAPVATGGRAAARPERANRVAHAEASARTVDAAVTAAAAQLGLRPDQVDVEVLEEPVPSTFGYIGSPARVRVTPSSQATLPPSP